jgi:hypothetical protein
MVQVYSYRPLGKHRFQLFFYCCVRIRCRGNVFTQPLPRNGQFFLAPLFRLSDVISQYGIHVYVYNIETTNLADSVPVAA